MSVECKGVSVSGPRLYAGGAAIPTVPRLFTFCSRYVLAMLASFTVCSCCVLAGKLNNKSLTITSLGIVTVKLAIVVLVIVKLIGHRLR